MGSSPLILIVDDEPHIRDVVRFALKREGFRTEEAGDGQEALQKFESLLPDLLVLDVLMPERDGTEVCRVIRARSNVPILFLSSRDDEIDRILGLELGGDDYLTKPFSPRELVARVKAVLRRADSGRSLSELEVQKISAGFGPEVLAEGEARNAEEGAGGRRAVARVPSGHQAEAHVPSGHRAETHASSGHRADPHAPSRHRADPHAPLACGRLRLDIDRFQAYWDEREVGLTVTEFGILRVLLGYPGKVFQREELMDGVYGYDTVVSDRTIDSHIRRVRAKFKRVGGEPIETVHGLGYKLGECS